MLSSIVAYFTYLRLDSDQFQRDRHVENAREDKTKYRMEYTIVSNDTCLRSRPSRIPTHFVRRASVKCQYSTGPTAVYGKKKITAVDT